MKFIKWDCPQLLHNKQKADLWQNYKITSLKVIHQSRYCYLYANGQGIQSRFKPSMMLHCVNG